MLMVTHTPQLGASLRSGDVNAVRLLFWGKGASADIQDKVI